MIDLIRGIYAQLKDVTSLVARTNNCILPDFCKLKKSVFNLQQPEN